MDHDSEHEPPDTDNIDPEEAELVELESPTAGTPGRPG